MSPIETERKTTLTTPSRGVQQWRDDKTKGETWIAWATTGSRGVPRTLIKLPVVLVYWGDSLRWVPPPTLMKELEGDPETFWRTYPLRESLDSRRNPAEARPVRDDCGKRWDAHHLVVLLEYDESPGIGEPEDGQRLAGNGDRPADNGQRHGKTGHRDEAEYRAEIARIKEFFNEDYKSRRVIRGLVRLPALTPPAKTGEFVFALASCQYPADMTDGAPNDHEVFDAPSSASMLRLSRLLTPMTPASPSLLLLVGDQVYVDATAGICDVRSQSDRLRLPYENLLASPGAQAVFGLLPVAMMLDDHELINNWEPGIVIDAEDAAPRQLVPPTPEQIETATKKRIEEGKAAYRRFQRMAGPPLRKNSAALWCTFTQSGVPFFLADTRTERSTPDLTSRRVDNWRQARIMGREQWGALREFLLEHRQEVSFVVSPSILLPRRLGLGSEPSLALEHDAWDGFPASMHDVLAFLCEHQLNRVVFLSGDAHTSCVVQATVTDGTHSATFWSVHSSGLYSPYPFANDICENYADGEVFHFRVSEDSTGVPARYRCKVERAEFFPGDGFAILTLTHTGVNRDVLQVRFNRAGCNSEHSGCNSADAGCNLEGPLIRL